LTPGGFDYPVRDIKAVMHYTYLENPYASRIMYTHNGL
jgi:hypothetical protein